VSVYPVMLDGSSLSALIVGGGLVAARKARALVDAGARVHVVAPRVAPDIEALAAGSALVTITRERYASYQLGAAMLVITATDDAALNAEIAREARDLGRLVNVVDAPELGNCVTPAVHRAGDLVVAVTAGGLPSAAVRVRDSIARTFDDRYAQAVRELGALRRSMIDGDTRERWQQAADALLGADFCESVESGDLRARLGEWR
jgi:precorrin-2 dehydrogenase / sirohydrochlorin ferrochelatase